MVLVGLSIISIFKCKRHYRSRIKLRDNGEDGGWQTTVNYPSVCGGILCLLYFIIIYYVVSLQIASLAPSIMLRAMAAGTTSQTTPVQIVHFFMLLCCVVLHKSSTSAFLIPVRVLLVM